MKKELKNIKIGLKNKKWEFLKEGYKVNLQFNSFKNNIKVII